MTKIVMLLSNAFRPDPRVLKEAHTLVKAGYRVTVLCWDRKCEFPQCEQIDGIDIQRFHIKSAYSSGSRQMFYLPRFWIQTFRTLIKLSPQIVHCHDLDTTVPGYLFARLHHTPWIYDAHECYPEQIKPQVHRLIYRGLLGLERFISPRATRLITVGDLLAMRFRSFGARTEIIGNYPEPASFDNLPIPVTRQELGIPPDHMIVAYIGGFTLAREILPLIQSSALLQEVTVILAGDGPQRQIIETALTRHPNVRYLGWIPQAKVPAYTSLADVMFYGLNPLDGNNQYSAPNALFNAMAAGKPMLTTDVGEIAHIVKETNCGIVIPRASPEAIAAALNQLKDAALHQELSANASIASAAAYNWGYAQAKLLETYRQIQK